ncbi:hypothetical protein B0I35DRAFT_47972 [Stachybotrys elegans]|uniref:Uncharacterized protein n=1 Tax=Stachybotrys elegans TaxID=80388 RepID=A0A8K0WXU6_9HYPO|nr:hypothetical protein B0I35DRAFT_47972 [Stachybotrys elegans]
MSNSDGASASDIITYIGVPLAVLGVLPILYNTFATLASLSRIRRMLRRSQLTALTRSDVVNRIIEIELPRYAVMPLDRFQNDEEYWSLCSYPSSLPGGSWTTFNWRTNTIGMKTQRIQYADQVRQPQVEIAFDDLVCYLLDLGAVPDRHGWKLLKSTGLWTPAGCCLMFSPDGKEKALVLGPQDDADGHLSLAVSWSSSWTTRHHSHLPPYWVRLPAGRTSKIVPESRPSSASKRRSQEHDMEEGCADPDTSSDARIKDESHYDGPDPQDKSQRDITCQILTAGVTTAFFDNEMQARSEIDNVDIDHLRIHSIGTDGIWFASAASAYGITSQTILWSYKIPDAILQFVNKETVPCGILVLLGMVDESETPDWATQHNDHMTSHELFVRRTREHNEALAAESRMSPADRQAASAARVRREMQQRMDDMRDKTRMEQQRAEQRVMEAVQSPRWSGKLVAKYALSWLQRQGYCDEDHGVKEVVGFLLHRMVRERDFSTTLCRMLDAWKSWADIGGMRKTDYQAIREDVPAFAFASLLVALIMDTSTTLEGTLSVDMQDCLKLWEKVRLG